MQGAAVLPAALHHYCTVRNVRGEATERVRAGAATFALHVHVVGSRRGRAVLPARALPDCRSLSLSARAHAAMPSSPAPGVQSGEVAGGPSLSAADDDASAAYARREAASERGQMDGS